MRLKSLGACAAAVLFFSGSPRAAEGPTPGGDFILDEFSTNRWSLDQSGSPEVQASLAPGHDGMGLRLSYALRAPGSWVGISRSVAIPEPMSKSITFYYKLDAGDRDRIEVRVTGDDGAVYRYETPVWITEGRWVMAIANVAEFVPVDEANKGKSLKSVERVEILFWSDNHEQRKVITVDDLQAISVSSSGS